MESKYIHLFKNYDSRAVALAMQHEDASVMMLDHLIKDNGLMEEMEIYKLDDNDVTFIKELIVGSSQNADRTPSQKVSC